jgi:hypothetical protein
MRGSSGRGQSHALCSFTMLPSWVNDIAALVGIITGLPVIFGWIMSWLGRGFKPPSISQPLQPAWGHSVSLWSLIKTGIFHLFIRPEIPAWRDALDVILVTIMLISISIFYIWNRSLPIELQQTLLLQLAFPVISSLWIMVTLLWARLFLKMRYLNQIPG